MTTASLAGREIYFHEPQTAWRKQFATDREGVATVRRSFSNIDAAVEIMVRHPGDGQRRPGAQAKARVFVWPSETSLLLIDAEQTLPDLDAVAVWITNNLDIRPRHGAVPTLREARAKYRIAYLSAGADLPSRYNKLHAWLERGWASEQEQFPEGPVLARASRLAPCEAAEFLQTTLKDLRQRFRGTLVGIAGDRENARLFRDAGWRTYLLSAAGDAPEGVTVIKSWSELNRRLP